ncbi:hypothetical protein SSS_09613 [Sarcoptes scabiei]|nr:hypothetical protein SSS_09613 [Sarcoptes scabiei]
MSIDKLLIIIRSHSIQGQLEELLNFINNENVFKNTLLIDEIIQNLDIHDNSVAILYLLNRLPYNSGTKQSIIRMIEFISDCNASQIKRVSNHFTLLCHRLTDYLIKEDQPSKGLLPLSIAVTKIQESSTQLTSIHSDICKLALLSKCFQPVLNFLNVDITDISRENDRYDVKYFLTYYYYGGMIYSILEQYERAFLFFQNAISITGTAISQISIESIKNMC